MHLFTRRNFNRNVALGMASSLLTGPIHHLGREHHNVRKIPKTDTHVHLFDLAQLQYSWLKNAPEINRSFNLEDFHKATKKDRVTKILFMESGTDPGFNVKEAQMVSSLAGKESRIRGIIAKLNLLAGPQSRSQLDDLLALPLLKGIRGAFPNNGDDPTAFIERLQWLEPHQLTFDLLLTPARLPYAASIIEKCPANIFILDHLGNPDVAAHEWKSWQTGIDALAALPNVNCKLSGIITRAGKGWKQDQISPYIQYVIKQFGMDRLVYGGDWPVVLRAGSYHSWSRAFEKITKQFDRSDLNKMYHQNADRIYNLI